MRFRPCACFLRNSFFQGTTYSCGAFADGQWSSFKGNYSFNCPDGCVGPTSYIGQLKNDWSWSVGGRIGIVALPGLLTYVNGGYAQGHFTGVNYLDGQLATLTGLVQGAQTRDGWFLGGGTEYAVTQLPGLFWKSEYRVVDYGTKVSPRFASLLDLAATPVRSTRSTAATPMCRPLQPSWSIASTGAARWLPSTDLCWNQQRKSPGIVRGFFLSEAKT